MNYSAFLNKQSNNFPQLNMMFGENNLDYAKLFDNIVELTTSTHIGIYVSIGGAKYKIEDNLKNDHEYPYVMRKWKKLFDNTMLIIFVVDPLMKKYDPTTPYFINKYGINELKENWVIDPFYSNIYHNYKENIHIIKIAKYFDGPQSLEMKEHDGEILDGYNFCNTINSYAQKFKWFVHVNDFSGANINYLAKYYDLDLKDDISHIVYGNSNRISSCCPDMCSPSMDFVFNIDDKNVIHILNINNYKNNIYKFSQLLPVCSKEYNIIIQCIIDYCCYTREFLEKNINIIRCLKVSDKTNASILKIIDMYYFDLKLFSTIENKLDSAVETLNYNEIINSVLNIIENKLISLLSITNKSRKDILNEALHIKEYIEHADSNMLPDIYRKIIDPIVENSMAKLFI